MDKIILLHGIWSVDAFMRPLARALQHHYEPHIFTYSSVFHSSQRTKDRLVYTLENTQASYIVGHSLGGVLALQTLAEHPHLQKQVKRLVCLGSPLKGSQVVHKLGSVRGGHRLVGHSFDALHSGCAPWTGTTQVAVIAGNKAQGLGQFLAPFVEESDGTVGISETQLDGIAHHCVVPASHSGLLWCPTTAELTAHFLQQGCFPNQTPP